MCSTRNLSSFRIFTIIWFGQLVSMLGTGMTRFALIIWAYQQTGSATTLALLGFFAWLPYLLVSPVAGVWVDKLDRRRVLLLADLGSGVLTCLALTLLFTGELAIWHIYLIEALTSVFDAFQRPAYIAATSTLLDKKEYARASGMRSLAYNGSQIGAPILAGALLPLIGIQGVMTFDIITFGIAMLTLAVVRIPRPLPAEEGEQDEPFLTQVSFGFRYIFARKGLMGLMFLFAGIEFFAALTYFSVMPALILARSGGSETALGLVQATLGVGGVVGGLLVSIWGLPRRKIHAVCGLCGLSFLLGDMLFATGRTLPAWIIAAAVAAVFIPFITSGYMTIWQSKVAPALQGRVFATADMFRSMPKPIGYLIAGPIADWWLEPAMLPGGALAPTFGWLVGTGPGAGIGLMFAGTALLGGLMSFSGYLFRSVRRVEEELPDYDAPVAEQSLAPSDQGASRIWGKKLAEQAFRAQGALGARDAPVIQKGAGPFPEYRLQRARWRLALLAPSFGHTRTMRTNLHSIRAVVQYPPAHSACEMRNNHAQADKKNRPSSGDTAHVNPRPLRSHLRSRPRSSARVRRW
jgi:MFS transporter, DHA3 family, macrolide efflux protein